MIRNHIAGVFLLLGVTGFVSMSCSRDGIISPKEDSFSSVNYDYLDSIEDRPDSRYIALGFDDFRDSDFSLIIPLFNKYGAKAVFNRIHRSTHVTDDDVNRVNMVLGGGHELGDHTFLHQKFPYDEPLFNGQNPINPDGEQVPFPSNSQMRDDVGGGRNVFGHLLSASVKETMGYEAPEIETCWGQLKDEECQYIREYFSVMKESNTGIIKVLDELSNMYLGTSGCSNGSWDNSKGCYTDGIFTGCKTSANHEIWERICLITKRFVREHFGVDVETWSWPGSKSSLCYFERNGNYYYDSEFSQLSNNLAKFESSLTGIKRSWTDVLRQFGYKNTHDATYPARIDGQNIPYMSLQYIMNASLSRPDALIYPTNRAISYTKIAEEYSDEYITNCSIPIEAQMYDVGGSFKTAIETWRRYTANGVVWGEVIDSKETLSERVILEGLLKYGIASGIKFVTKAEAYDICFNQKIDNGNLIYNPKLRNTAKEFLLDAKTVPSNPDGYVGNCYVTKEDSTSVLVTDGLTTYDHFGIPYGKIRFAALVKGDGNIRIKQIKNNTDFNAIDNSEIIGDAIISSENKYGLVEIEVDIPDNGISLYEQKCSGWGNKIIGIRIEYSPGLQVKKMKLFKL